MPLEEVLTQIWTVWKFDYEPKIKALRDLYEIEGAVERRDRYSLGGHPGQPEPLPRGLLSGDDIPRTTEIILSFDDDFDEFSRRLQQLSKEWEASGLRELGR